MFGPNAKAGGDRPSDPDSTGGYYQPVRAILAGADTSFFLARIRCDLATADADTARAFAAAYQPNQNPELLPLTESLGGSSTPLTAVPIGERIVLRASWPPSAAESFAYFDPALQTVTTQRESMQVAWYSSGGAFDTESTGRASTDETTSTDNGWTAPNVAGTVHIWIVLRDSRGGVDFTAYDLAVGD
jgi:hypothetical protein